MTKSQIEKILTDLDYDLDMELKLDEISTIALSTDNVLYPETNERFYFDSDDNLLFIYTGYEDDEHNFIKNSNLPKTIISYDIIEGINFKNDVRIKTPYRSGRSV